MRTRKNLLAEAQSLTDFWTPRVVDVVNDQYVKVARVKGSLAWHKHDNEDEMFLILKGSLNIEYEDSLVELHEGDIHVVPRDTLHNPVCEQECLIALIEPRSTLHTGTRITDKTVPIETQLADYRGENG